MTTKSAPAPDRFPHARGRVLGRPEAWVWPVLGLAAAVGAGLAALVADRPAAAAVTYVVTLAIVIGCFAISTLNLRMAGRISPGVMFGAAIFSYSFTIAVLSFAWLLSSPRVVVGPAVFAGAAVAVLVWTGGVVRASWVR